MSFREDYACPGSDGAIHRQRDPRQDTVKPERQRRRLYCGPKEARGSQQFLPSIGQYFPIHAQRIGSPGTPWVAWALTHAKPRYALLNRM